MSSQRESLYSVIAWTAGMTLATFLFAIPARAQRNNGDYLFFIGSGFLCQANDSSACPAVAKSADDSTYELSGAGTLAPQNKSVTAAGTFTHKSTDGVVLATGVWIASELVSFDSYGVAPGALTREGRALGPPQFGPECLPMFSCSMPTGGRAVLRIRLIPVLGFAKNATLQVNCALGKVPPEHQVEGVRLTFERGGVEFDEEISGRALFLLTRPGASAAAKAPAPEVDTNPAPNEVQQ